MIRTRSLAGALALAACVTSVATAQSPSPSGASGESLLAEAFWFLPPGGTDVAFTDWDRIRRSQGALDLTGESPLDDKAAFLMATARDEAAASGFALARFRDHRAVWGFDTLDLDWEATYTVDGPPVFVLRFRDGFDLAPVAALFDERGFTSDPVDGAVVRSHDMDPTADWLLTTEFAILNTAFLDDGRTLVLSSGRDALTEVLAARYRRGAHEPAAVIETLDAIDGASAALVLLGLGTCLGFTPPPFELGAPDPSLRPLRTGEPLHPYAALGVAYARPGWDPVGRIVMGFPDPTWAGADAEARAEMARSGTSLRTLEPYSESVLALHQAEVRERALVLHVAPADDIPRRLFQMVWARDMAFAGC
jgi:hypothetical protein